VIKVRELKKFDTYIIAEIGINHNGDLDVAKKLIEVAKEAGCDMVKFQKRNPEVSIPEDQKFLFKDTPWGRMRYLYYKNRIEFEEEEYNELNAHCSILGIDWTASVWDLDSVEFMRKYQVPFIKIPSAKLTDDDLIKACLDNFWKIIISTGMSSREEIDHAVSIVRKFRKPHGLQTAGLLHCTSSYPAPTNELNLSAINTLKKRYPDFEIGYSSHETSLNTASAAVYLGASIIEKHITLDKSSWGTDQALSLEPQELKTFVKNIRELEEAYGEGKLEMTQSELIAKEKLRG
jgi:N-acetylneuraminate synthase